MSSAVLAEYDQELSQEGEQAWLRLKQHLEWCDQFALGFIFTQHPLVTAVFRNRLSEIFRARVTRLDISVPDSPDQLIDNLLPNLIQPPGYRLTVFQPFWIDLSSKTGTDWAKARQSFLVRLNEQRELLRTKLQRPVILLLPQSEKASIKAMVPDLWAIRDFSLDTRNWLQTKKIPPEPVVSPQRKAFPPSDFHRSIIEEWERVKNKKVTDRGILLAGERAYSAYMETGRLGDAIETARDMVKFSRELVKLSRETPESLRDLSVSLDNVGNTAVSQGDLSSGQDYFKESLEIRRKLLSRVGETPESLRDLSVSLNNMGNTAVSQGDLSSGQDYFQEGLQIASDLLKAFPNNREISGLVPHFKERLKDVKKGSKRDH